MGTFAHKGKVIAVTGGARGIGEAIVRRLCAEGAHVFATYNASSTRADAIVCSSLAPAANCKGEPVAARST